jgi:hypothetical protein
LKVQRIQDRKLWNIYYAELTNIREKYNNQEVEEKFLYHGTRATDPKLIVEGEEGFDLRYAKDGMWGQAVYFAVNSSYSNDYAYTIPGTNDK